MPVSNTGGGLTLTKVLIALEHILGADIDEDDNMEARIDEEVAK